MSAPLPQKHTKAAAVRPETGAKGRLLFVRFRGEQARPVCQKDLYDRPFPKPFVKKCTNIARKFLRLFRGCFSTISLKMAENVVLFLYKLLRDMGGQPKAPIGKR